MTTSTTIRSGPGKHVDGRHAGKVALVTGGARGIGAGIVRRLAAEGARVTFTYASATNEAEALVSTITDSGGQAAGINANSADRAQVREVIADLVTQKGRLDIVVSNADGGTKKRVGELSDDEIDRMIDVNIGGALDTVRFSAPHLQEGGRVIVIGSVSANHFPDEVTSLYGMTKGAVASLVRGMSREFGPRGVTINNVQSGPVDTPSNPVDGPAGDMLRDDPRRALRHRRGGRVARLPPRQRGRRLHERRLPGHRRRIQRLNPHRTTVEHTAQGDLGMLATPHFHASDDPEFVRTPAVTYASILGSGSPGTDEFYRKKVLIGDIARQLGNGTTPVIEIQYWYPEGSVPVEITDFYSVNPVPSLRYRVLAAVPNDTTAEDLSAARTRAASSSVQAIDDLELFTIPEHDVVQIMHHGPFAEEFGTLARLGTFARTQGKHRNGPHHELHLDSFTRETPQDTLRTILRDPVA